MRWGLLLAAAVVLLTAGLLYLIEKPALERARYEREYYRRVNDGGPVDLLRTPRPPPMPKR